MILQGLVLLAIAFALVMIIVAVHRLESYNDCHELIVASHIDNSHSPMENGPSLRN